MSLCWLVFEEDRLGAALGGGCSGGHIRQSARTAEMEEGVLREKLGDGMWCVRLKDGVGYEIGRGAFLF